MKGLSIVIPVYNEENEIGKVIGTLKAVVEKEPSGCEIIVVNDGSTDGTKNVLDGETGIMVIDNTVNMGYGASLKRGIDSAKYELIAIADADNTYPVEVITELARLMDNFDMVIGERKKIAYPRFNWIKQRGRDAMDFLCSYLVGHRIPDINSGLRVFKKDMALRFKDRLCDRFSFTTSLTLLSFFNGYKVSYIPIDYCLFPAQRKTKVRIWKDGWRTLLMVISLGLDQAPARTVIFLSVPVLVILILVLFI